MNSNQVAKHNECSSLADLLGGAHCIRMTGFPLASLRFFISLITLAHSVAKVRFVEQVTIIFCYSAIFFSIMETSSVAKAG